jgi:hypothetical protein
MNKSISLIALAAILPYGAAAQNRKDSGNIGAAAQRANNLKRLQRTGGTERAAEEVVTDSTGGEAGSVPAPVKSVAADYPTTGYTTYTQDAITLGGVTACVLAKASIDSSIVKKNHADVPMDGRVLLSDLIDKEVLKRYNDTYVAEREDYIKKHPSEFGPGKGDVEKYRNALSGDLYVIVLYDTGDGRTMPFGAQGGSAYGFATLAANGTDGTDNLNGESFQRNFFWNGVIDLNYKNLNKFAIEMNYMQLDAHVRAGSKNFRLAFIGGKDPVCKQHRPTMAEVHLNDVMADIDPETEPKPLPPACSDFGADVALGACNDISEKTLDEMDGLLLGSTISSGIGAASAAAGAITGGIGTSMAKKDDEKSQKTAQNLRTASIITSAAGALGAGGGAITAGLAKGKIKELRASIRKCKCAVALEARK